MNRTKKREALIALLVIFTDEPREHWISADYTSLVLAAIRTLKREPIYTVQDDQLAPIQLDAR